jgi:urease accessory protein
MAPELFIWLSPAFPVGAYAYSQGLESAADQGFVLDRGGLECWITDVFERGAAGADLICLSLTYRAAAASTSSGDIAAINEMCLALQPSAERYLETTQQGGSFLDAIADAWPRDQFAALGANVDRPVAYPVAVGLAAAARNIGLADTLVTFALASATNLTSAAIRLSIVGQTDAQRVLAALSSTLTGAAHAAEYATVDDLTTSTWSADLTSLEHETQYTRLFRS